MCFFSAGIPRHKPVPYFKGACNEFDFGLILKSKEQLSISDNNDGYSISVFSCTSFQNWPKTLFFSKSKVIEKFVFKGAKCLRKHLEPIYWHKKSKNLQASVIFNIVSMALLFTKFFKIILNSN